MTLHPDAAMRVLRNELLRLNDGRPELILALEDPRIPSGVAAAQLKQVDAEIGELVFAIRVLEIHWADEMKKAAA